MMRTSIIAASLALVSYAAAQGVAGLPQCAQKCLEPFADENGIAGCGGFDIKCICSSGGFLNKIGCCLLDACSETDQQAAIAFAANICKTSGVTVPSEITCNETSATTTDSAALSSTVSSISSAISSASSEISKFVSSRSESSESVASPLSSASSALTASAGATTSFAGGAATSAASAISSAGAAATSVVVESGAMSNAVNIGGILGAAGAALALL